MLKFLLVEHCHPPTRLLPSSSNPFSLPHSPGFQIPNLPFPLVYSSPHSSAPSFSSETASAARAISDIQHRNSTRPSHLTRRACTDLGSDATVLHLLVQYQYRYQPLSLRANHQLSYLYLVCLSHSSRPTCRSFCFRLRSLSSTWIHHNKLFCRTFASHNKSSHRALRFVASIIARGRSRPLRPT